LVFSPGFELRNPNSTEIPLPFLFYAALSTINRDEPLLKDLKTTLSRENGKDIGLPT